MPLDLGDHSAVAGVIGWDAQSVEVGRDRPAALTPQSQALVDVGDDGGSRAAGPHLRIIGDQAGRLLLAIDPQTEGDDAAQVATGPGRPVDATGGIGKKLHANVVTDDRLDVGDQGIAFSGRGHETDAQGAEEAARAQDVRCIPTQAVGGQEPDLVDGAREGVAHQKAATGALPHGDGAADAIIDVAGHDLHIGLARQASIQGVGLGRERASLGLVIAANPGVYTHLPDPCRHGHRTPP